MEVAYCPSPWQQTFHALPHTEALGAGAAGPGKTLCLLWDPLPQIMIEHERCENRNHPYHHGWGDSVGVALHLRRTLIELEQSIQYTHRIFPKLDPGARWDLHKTTWAFSSGFRFQFGHCKDLDSWTNFMSSSFSHIAFDELVTFTQEQYEQIKTRCRTTDPVLAKMLKIRAMSNPCMSGRVTSSVIDPDWVRKYFVDPAPDGRVTLKREIQLDSGEVATTTRIYMPATLFDNPNKAFVKDYEVRLASAPPHIRQALLYGNWYFTAGAYFGDVWDARLHVCKPFKIPPDWLVFRSMDWGYKAPGCVGWYAMDEDENLWKFKELTFQGKAVDEVAKMIEQIEKDLGLWQGKKSLIHGVADTQLWEDRGDVGLSKAVIMAKNGVAWHRAVKGKGSRGVNAERLMMRLSDHQNGTTTPGIVFFKNCEKTIRTIPMIQTDPNRPDLPMDGGDDHWLDETLYACEFASHGKAGIGRRKLPKNPWEVDDEPWKDDNLRASRGRDGYGGW
jgi:hypothetical protein